MFIAGKFFHKLSVSYLYSWIPFIQKLFILCHFQPAYTCKQYVYAKCYLEGKKLRLKNAVLGFQRLTANFTHQVGQD